MVLLRIRSRLAAFLCLPLLFGCAANPWDDPIDVTQLLRMDPEQVEVMSMIPRGLGESGKALFQWTILKPDGSVDANETFELRRRGDARLSPEGRTQATYVLARADHKRFQTQQIRQRAQLLAGFYNMGLAVVPGLCDRAGVQAGAEVVYSVLMDGAAGTTITTLRVDALASDLERSAPYCV